MAAGGWVPFKELSHVIRWALLNPEREAYFALEEALKKHRPDFTNLLENPVRTKEGERKWDWNIVPDDDEKLDDNFVILQSQTL